MTELVFKFCAVAIFGSVAAILLKQREPELALLLTVCASAVILTAALRLGEGIKNLVMTINQNSKIEYEYILPVFKCAAVGITVKLSTSICSDSSQKTLVSALELCGALSALSVSMPILTEFISVICKFI